jgi:NAD+ diphosphatase
MHLKAMPFALPDLFIGHTKKDHTKANSEFWFIFQDSQLLVLEDSMQPVQEINLPFECSLYIGVHKEFHLHAGQIPPALSPPKGTVWKDLKSLYGHISEELFALAGRAVQLIAWDRSHQFCGRCGHQTHEKPNERAKECPSCKLVVFPRISPAVMALIQRDDEILLARGPHFPIGRYSALAGFVEPGETLEQCVKREVFEEVGLHVDDIHYFASQSWPFPNSLMIAFTCRWKSGEIKIDPSEIEDAQWFTKETLPLLPSEMSISRILIEAALSKLGDFL